MTERHIIFIAVLLAGRKSGYQEKKVKLRLPVQNAGTRLFAKAETFLLYDDERITGVSLCLDMST